MTRPHLHPHFDSFHESKTKLVDVRSKIIATFLMTIVGSLLVAIEQLIFYFFILVIFIICYRPRLGFIKQYLAILPIILSLTVISFFSFKEGLTVYGNPLFTTTHTNFTFAIFSGLRSLLLATFLLILINSEDSFFEIIYGLDGLKMPSLLTNLIFFTYRFIFIFQEEFIRILEARDNRLYGERRFFNIKSLIIIGTIIGSVLARSFKRAEQISAALAARGFDGKLNHPLRPYTIGGLLFILLSVILALLLVVYGQYLLFDLLFVN